MNILNAVMVPHPPLIIPQVGRGEEKQIQATVDAYGRAAAFVAAARPETVVVISPHSAMYYDWFHISPGAGARGDFGSFGAAGVGVEVRYDQPLAEELCRRAREAHFPAGTQGQRDPALDHATMIPLWFLQRALGDDPLPPVVRIGLAGLPLADHYRLGLLLRQSAEALGQRISVIASGDLSHKLKPDGPYGFRPEGPQYDRRIMEVMGAGRFDGLFGFSDGFCDAAGECGHRSFTIMAGCFDGYGVTAQALSYEGPFGVGYGVCLFQPGQPDGSRRFLQAEEARRRQAMEARRSAEDPWVRLARSAVEQWVRSGTLPALPKDLPAELTARRAGVFVSLHIDGALRGCIGTTGATAPSAAAEILQNAVSACSRDPRFPPVTADELPRLEYSVDVLGPAEAIDGPEQLDVKRYGVIVTCGRRRGLLLPDLEGVDTVEDQIAIARQKAGIAPGQQTELQRFEVVRHV